MEPPTLVPKSNLGRDERNKYLYEYKLEVLVDSISTRESEVGKKWVAERVRMRDLIARHQAASPAIQRLYAYLAKRKENLDDAYYKVFLTAFPDLPEGDNLEERLRTRYIKTQDWVTCSEMAVYATWRFVGGVQRDIATEPEWKSDSQALEILNKALAYAEKIDALNKLQREVAREYLKWNQIILEGAAAKDSASLEEQTKLADAQHEKVTALQVEWGKAELSAGKLRGEVPWMEE